MGEAMMNAKQIAAHFGVSNSTARSWLLQGLFPGAVLRESEVGVSYWVAPKSTVHAFVPPKRGPVPKKPISTKASASNGTAGKKSASKKGGKR